MVKHKISSDTLVPTANPSPRSVAGAKGVKGSVHLQADIKAEGNRQPIAIGLSGLDETNMIREWDRIEAGLRGYNLITYNCGCSLPDGPMMFFDMYSHPNYPGDGDIRTDNYPYLLRVPLDAGDDEYFSILESSFPRYLEACSDAKLAFYNAGTDILAGDKVGKLGISYDGVLRRDRYVIEALRKAGIPP